MRTYLYTCIHIPTGMMFARSARYDSLLEFYRAICKWNTQDSKAWAYAPTGDAR